MTQKEQILPIGIKYKKIKNFYERNMKNSMQNSTEEAEALLDATNMNQEEFIEFYLDRTKKLEIISKWSYMISNKINDDELKIEDEEFNNKCQEYQKSEEPSTRVTLLLELVEMYENYLMEQATVEFIN